MDKEKLREKYGLKHDEKIILFVGRLERIKNIDFLIRSFVIVMEKISKAKLVIVGRGKEQKNLINLAKKLGIEKKTFFVGEVNPEKMPEVYNYADVVALPSISEASHTVVKEALACGVPVVSTNVGDVIEIITNPIIGTVVNSYDEKLFANALIKTIEIVNAKPEEVRKKCRKIALERFSFENIAKEFIDIYKEALGRRR